MIFSTSLFLAFFTIVFLVYWLSIQVFFEDGTEQFFDNRLNFYKETLDWHKVKTKAIFKKNVVVIKPYMLFYGSTGYVWFDDVKVFRHAVMKQKKIFYQIRVLKKNLKSD